MNTRRWLLGSLALCSTGIIGLAAWLSGPRFAVIVGMIVAVGLVAVAVVAAARSPDPRARQKAAFEATLAVLTAAVGLTPSALAAFSGGSGAAAAIPPRITSPVNGVTTAETRIAVRLDAPAPRSGHRWYVAVQPARQSASFYFHGAVPTGGNRYVAQAGVGPSGARGAGIYTLHLVDADDAAVRTIEDLTQHNIEYYNDHGMALPAGTSLVDSVEVQRTG